jgi:hypothetical protein
VEPRLLITGRGTSGSWLIRGVQLGNAIGATVIPNALDVAGYPLAVVVKRPGDVLDRLHAAGVPIIWDIVDSYPQPVGNDWSRAECIAWLHQQLKKIRPVGVVAATQAMASLDFGVPVLALPHHHRPNIAINPIRERVVTVGYEGGENYIAKWRPQIERLCHARGWLFVTNPARLADVDIVLALRDQSGYAPRYLKSNVKLANAQGSGTPIICNKEAGYLETASGGEVFIDDDQLPQAFDMLADQSVRKELSGKLRQGAITLESVAATYKAWLKTFLN